MEVEVEVGEGGGHGCSGGWRGWWVGWGCVFEWEAVDCGGGLEVDVDGGLEVDGWGREVFVRR